MRLVLKNNVRIDLDDFFSDHIGKFFAPIPDPSRPEPDLVDIHQLMRDPNIRLEREPGRTYVLRGDMVLLSLTGEFETLEDWDERTNSVWDGYEKLLEFLTERMRVSLLDSGFRYDLVNAAMATKNRFKPEGLGNYEYDAVRLLARVKALQAFVGTDDGADLLIGYKRAANILKKEKWEERREPRSQSYEPLPEEAELDEALDAAEPRAEQAVAEEDFERAMKVLASLRAPVDAFFDHVTVNDPDPAKRERRLNLLARFRDAVHRVADFSKIEG